MDDTEFSAVGARSGALWVVSVGPLHGPSVRRPFCKNVHFIKMGSH